MHKGCIAAVLCIAGSCGAPDTFLCETDIECGEGQCELNGFCSFEDGSCESGRRYGEHAGQVSGNCVAGDGTGTTEATPSDSTSDDLGDSTTTGPDTGTTLSLADSGSTADADSGPSGASSDDSSSTASDGYDSSDGSGSSSGGPPMDHPYQDCQADDECPAPGSLCMAVTTTPPQCLPPCMRAADCPEPPEPTNDVTCLMSFCFLTCGGMSECPSDLECASLGYCTPPSP